MTLRVRRAVPADGEALAGLYADGIRTRRATFRTSEPTPEEMADRVATAGPRHPVVVAEVDGRVVGCAWLDPYSANPWYADVAEFSVYVEEGHRLGGLATLLVGAVVEAGRSAGVRKVTAKVLAGNRASRRMCASLGFREVGVHLRHGRLDGRWRDVVIVERLLDDVTG